MNLQVLRSPAEQALADGFETVARQLPGSGWVERIRRAGLEAFKGQGLPHRRLEAWKYTDLRERLKEVSPHVPGAPPALDAAGLDAALGPLAKLDAARLVLVDGAFAPELSSAGRLEGAAEVMALAPLLAKAPAWLEGKFADGRLGALDAIAALNTAYMSDGVLLKIKPGAAAPCPVMVVHVRASRQPVSVATRNIIAIEAGASLTLIEVHVALPGAARRGLVNALSDVAVADGGALTHLKCTMDDGEAAHLSSWSARIGAKARYNAFQLTAGAVLARNGLDVRLAGEGSQLDLSGAFLGRGRDHIDTTLIVEHRAPGCNSRELFKGVLEDHGRGVLQGKIIVRPEAQKTDGKQMAQALLLSPEAEFDSKPELEIYADDVACGHGSTCAEIDPDLVFYCRTRGIPEVEARTLLVHAFIGEALDKIEDEAIRSGFKGVAEAWLNRGAGAGAR